MAKVLKTVAVISSIAAAVVGTGGLALFGTAAGASLFGVGAGTLGLIATGATVGASLLAKRPKTPSTSEAIYDRLRANVDPRTPRKTMIGITASAADVRFGRAEM